MFDDPRFDKYGFENIPLDRDLYLMDEMWMAEYERSLLDLFSGRPYETVGYVSYVAGRSVSASGLELSWYPNIQTRFHEVHISLPRDQFVRCVGCWQCDEKPRIFVKTGWLTHLHLRTYSVFALVDAIDFKIALTSGALTRDNLILLRAQIDAIADRHRDILFISFADSVVLKSNFNVGQYDSKIRYTYEPEVFIRVIAEMRAAYREVLGIGVYAILTQGSNEYYDDSLVHISESGNHISLNSLGVPFAQLMSTEKSARANIRERAHGPADLYMDKNFFNSLSFEHSFKRESCGSNSYREPLMGEFGKYVFADCELILKHLRGPGHRDQDNSN